MSYGHMVLFTSESHAESRSVWAARVVDCISGVFIRTTYCQGEKAGRLPTHKHTVWFIVAVIL
jgi:hypothetical protein